MEQAMAARIGRFAIDDCAVCPAAVALAKAWPQ